jgi:large subunit ribosomal protein L9
MKVMLKENVEDLGKKGDIVRVAPGFGRNYLIPKQIAMEVTSTNTKMIEMVQKALRKGLEKEIASYRSQAEKLNAVTLTFERKAGEKDHIFGSVNVTDIRDALAAQGLEIEKKKILLDEPIKRLGNYTVAIKVFHDERAEIKLAVNKEGAVPETEEAEAPEEKIEEDKAEAQPEAESTIEERAAGEAAEEDAVQEAKLEEAEPEKEGPQEEEPVKEDVGAEENIEVKEDVEVMEEVGAVEAVEDKEDADIKEEVEDTAEETVGTEVKEEAKEDIEVEPQETEKEDLEAKAEEKKEE